MSQDINLSREDREELVTRLSSAMRATQAASDELDEAFTEFLGVNRTDGRCLEIIDRAGKVTAGELASQAGLTTGAVTTVIDRLEAAGYVRRSRDSADRRKVHVELTADAVEIGSQVYGPLAHAVAPLLEELSDDQLVALIRLLEAGTAINREQAARLRSRAEGRSYTLRERLTQAKRLGREAADLGKQVKADVKSRAVRLRDELIGRN
jgi:DNA-binding MarR family transcriptional regulator